VVEISVAGLAWCSKQTQEIFFFEKTKITESVVVTKKILGIFPFLQPKLLQLFQKQSFTFLKK
jgi:hypothetical protein